MITVTAAEAGDVRAEQRIRALGFIGWLTLQDHRAAHPVALARGTMGAHLE